MRNKIALGLHALAHRFAIGHMPSGIRWYTPAPESHLSPTPVIPDAVHGLMCPSQATVLHDAEENLVICAQCNVAIDLNDFEDAA
jgi:hypothetical protein